MQTFAPAIPWIHQFFEDQAPSPGRLASSLRILLASSLSLVLLLALQMPFLSLGLYLVLIVGRDSPAVSLRTAVVATVAVALSVFLVIGVVMVSDNAPIARVLSVAVVTFVAGLIIQTNNLGPVGSIIGIAFTLIISLWETHAPADKLVKGSLFLIGTAAIAFGCSVAVEYVFGSQRPTEQLLRQRRARYQALEQMFRALAQRANPPELAAAYVPVARLAAAGQAGMQALYHTIVDRAHNPRGLPLGAQVRITMLAQLMDAAAAFGADQPRTDDPDILRRCAWLAEWCHELMEGSSLQTAGSLPPSPATSKTLLDRVEEIVRVIRSMPVANGDPGEQDLIALPARRVPLVTRSELTNHDAVAFALKISLCATLCYIIYFALNYPGISTAVTTVLIAGLSTSGATKQKLTYRVVGSAIGGLVFGLGAITFLLPSMDSIASLILLVGSVTFLAAWISTGRIFGYVGMQIAYAFYFVAVAGSGAPTELAPARDRLVGILLALAIMWFVFDQIWPVRTITAMRKALATVLRDAAGLFRLPDRDVRTLAASPQVDALRSSLGTTVTRIRTMNDSVQYEFGPDRERNVRQGAMIVDAAFVSAAVFLNHLVALETEANRTIEHARAAGASSLQLRGQLAEGLEQMAAGLGGQNSPILQASEVKQIDAVVGTEPFQEYERNALSDYSRLRMIVLSLDTNTQQ
jgi:multidrug resistance protein MdtO